MLLYVYFTCTYALYNQLSLFRFGSKFVDKKNWTKMVDRLLNYYVEDLAEATSHGVDITDVTQHEYESESKWDFWGSLFYAGTVYTTIGRNKSMQGWSIITYAKNDYIFLICRNIS